MPDDFRSRLEAADDRTLDAMVEISIGYAFLVERDTREGSGGWDGNPRFFTTDTAHLEAIVDAMREKGWFWSGAGPMLDERPPTYSMQFQRGGRPGEGQYAEGRGVGSSLMRALCLACLLALHTTGTLPAEAEALLQTDQDRLSRP